MLNNENNISYHVDLPYPEIKVEKENSRYANILLHNYSGIVSEFTAIDQYVYHKFKLFKDCPAVSQAIGEIAMVEMHHLEMLGELILLLGEDPRYWIKKKDKRYYWNGKFVDYGNTLKEYLDYDIQAEVVAINNETNISYHVDLPYPDIKVEKENPRYANILLHNYSGIVSEFTAVDQYVYHKFKLFKDCPAVSQAIGEIAMVEMHHLEMLGELILLLGEDPRYWIKKKDKRYYWNGKFVDYGNTLKEYLDYDIQAEVVAIRDYNKALNEILILDEELHLKIFKELYAKYVKTPE